MQHEPRGAFEGPNTTAYQRFLPTGPIAFLPLSPTVSSLVWSTKPPIAKALLACDPPVLAAMINAAFRLPSVSLQYLYERILEAHAKNTPIQLSQIQQEIQFRENAHQIDQYSAYTSLVKNSQRQGIASDDAEAVPPLVTGLQANSAASFPLRFNHTDAYIGEGQGSRTALVGDAAHIVHPLAGQGLNMGLGDVECLSQCIEEAVVHGGDVG
jgi:ubiquinone biosynthesis monooxygenase Coq6